MGVVEFRSISLSFSFVLSFRFSFFVVQFFLYISLARFSRILVLSLFLVNWYVASPCMTVSHPQTKGKKKQRKKEGDASET